MSLIAQFLSGLGKPRNIDMERQAGGPVKHSSPHARPYIANPNEVFAGTSPARQAPKTIGEHFARAKNDLQMGLGLKDKTGDYYARTVNNLNRQQQANFDALGKNYTGNIALDNMAIRRKADRKSEPAVDLLGQARTNRQAAMDAKQKELQEAFSFANDDYYSGLSDRYMKDMLGAYNTAYDDAARGIYDSYKSSGLLNQAAVDGRLGVLRDAQSADPLSGYAQRYADANREFVSGGLLSIGDALSALSSASNDVDAINQQTEAIKKFNIGNQSAKYKTATEKKPTDFFSGFNKLAANPAANVAPTATSSNRSGASQSVDLFGANTQPSTLSGLRSPYSSKAIRVVS